MPETAPIRIKKPPVRSKNLLTDAYYFLVQKPKISTLIKFKSKEQREEFNNRIMQRMGIDVDQYSILNVHQIGVEAPPSYVFNELLGWNGDSTCWPNYVAKVERVNGRLEKIRILPFGWSKYLFSWQKSFLGLHIIPLFYLTSIRIKHVPDSFDFDNARYLLYNCRGGYPIGIFAMYVRSSIAEMGETEQSQLFFTVSFNFYGRKSVFYNHLFSPMWKALHNRVTAHVINKIKQLCEWRLEKMENNQIR